MCVECGLTESRRAGSVPGPVRAEAGSTRYPALARKRATSVRSMALSSTTSRRIGVALLGGEGREANISLRLHRRQNLIGTGSGGFGGSAAGTARHARATEGVGGRF